MTSQDTPASAQELDRIRRYQDEYISEYAFESEMVHYRHKLVLDFLTRHAPKTIVEIGCGSDLLAQHYHDQGGRWDAWVIVEPGDAFADVAEAAGLPNLRVIRGFFEAAAAQLTEKPAAIICSGLLHEVPDDAELCRSIAGAMGPDTVLHANVPNATSFHRQLAQAMGLLEELKTLSNRNKSLSQPRVFDMAALVDLAQDCGLRVTDQGGHLVKPYTHRQMEQTLAGLDSDTGRAVLDGLYELGRRNPDWASEIFIEARLA